MCAQGRGDPAHSVRFRGRTAPGARKVPPVPPPPVPTGGSPNRLGTPVLRESTGIPLPSPPNTGMGGAPLACTHPSSPLPPPGEVFPAGRAAAGGSRRRPPPRGCSAERGPTAPARSRYRSRRLTLPPHSRRNLGGKTSPGGGGGSAGERSPHTGARGAVGSR